MAPIEPVNVFFFFFNVVCNQKCCACLETCSLDLRVMPGRKYVGHRLMIQPGQFALDNLAGGVKVDDELEGVQDKSHECRL